MGSIQVSYSKGFDFGPTIANNIEN